MHGSMLIARDPPPRHSRVLGLLSPTGVGAPPTSECCAVLNNLSVRLPLLESPYVRNPPLSIKLSGFSRDGGRLSEKSVAGRAHACRPRSHHNLRNLQRTLRSSPQGPALSSCKRWHYTAAAISVKAHVNRNARKGLASQPAASGRRVGLRVSTGTSQDKTACVVKCNHHRVVRLPS